MESEEPSLNESSVYADNCALSGTAVTYCLKD